MHERAERWLLDNNAGLVEDLYFGRFLKLQDGGGVVGGERFLFKFALRIHSSQKKCSQMHGEINAVRKCNDVKQYVKLHFMKYGPVRIIQKFI